MMDSCYEFISSAIPYFIWLCSLCAISTRGLFSPLKIFVGLFTLGVLEMIWNISNVENLVRQFRIMQRNGQHAYISPGIFSFLPAPFLTSSCFVPPYFINLPSFHFAGFPFSKFMSVQLARFPAIMLMGGLLLLLCVIVYDRFQRCVFLLPGLHVPAQTSFLL